MQSEFLIARATLVLIEIILFSSFIWALTGWFKTGKTIERRELKAIKGFGSFFILVHLLIALFYLLPPISLTVTGIFILIASGVLFKLSIDSFSNPPGVAFGNEIVTELNMQGPYRYIRHPFYTSYSMAWIGGTIATGCWWLILTFLVMFYLYFKAAKEEEKQWLAGVDEKKYQNYMTKTGMFFFKLKY